MNEFDACATDQPSMMHEYKKLVEVGKLDTVVLPELNDVEECNVYLISVLIKLIQGLKQVFQPRILFLSHVKSQGEVFSNQPRMMWEAQWKIYFNIVVFDLESIVFYFRC